MDFNELDLRELDKNLTAEEKAEWNAIYASYRAASVVSGRIVGVDYYRFDVNHKTTGERETRDMPCLIVVRYRIKVVIPNAEVWWDAQAPEHLLRSMCGGRVDYVITHIDRENGFAVASRKRALERLRYASRRRNLENTIVKVTVVAVGKNVCTVTFGGYDVLLNQREISYSIVRDLRETLHPGDVRAALVTEWAPDKGAARFSIKETTSHPFDGIETRHPLGCARAATIVGKYAGGVFCRLFDGVTDVLCTYGVLHNDADFHEDDRVEIAVNKYNTEKKLVYGKIIRKMY